MNIPSRYAPMLFVLLMSTFMGLGMSGVMTLINTGWEGAYLQRWLQTFALSLPISFPLSLLVGSGVRRLVAWMTTSGQPAGCTK